MEQDIYHTSGNEYRGPQKRMERCELYFNSAKYINKSNKTGELNTQFR